MHGRGVGMELYKENGAGQGEPRFMEDESGATLDGGAAVCRFNTQAGGRLERWQWRKRNYELRESSPIQNS